MTEEKVWVPDAIIDAFLERCQLTISRGEGVTNYDNLNCKLRVVDEVRTPDGRKLNNADWGLELYRGGRGNELTEQNNAIGLLNYYPSMDDDGVPTPELCAAWVGMDEATFDDFRALAASGKLRGFRFFLKGIDYGWEPDGSAKEWDIEKYPNAYITAIEIISELHNNGKADDEELNLTSNPTANAPEPENKSINEIAAALTRTNSRLTWVLVLLGLLLVAAFLR